MNSIFQGSGFSFEFLKYDHNLTNFKSDFEFFSGMLLPRKVGVVDFTKAHGLVKF